MKIAFREFIDAYARAFRTLLFRNIALHGCDYGAPALLICLILALLSLLLAEFVQAFNGYYFWNIGFSSKLATWALFLLFAAVLTRNAYRNRLPHFLAVTSAIATIVNLAIVPSTIAWNYWIPPQYSTIPWITAAFLLWEAFAYVRIARFTFGDVPRFAGSKFLAAAIASALIVPAAPVFSGTSDPRAFVDAWNIMPAYRYYVGLPSESESTAPSTAAKVDVERAYYKQQAMLTSLLSNIETSFSDKKSRTYFLGFASDGSQSVFRRELVAVRDIVEARLGSKNRSLVLINSEDTIDGFPLANATNLQMAIDGIAKRMDTERDTLLLYITTHGSDDFLSVYLRGFSFNGLSASTLAEMLERSKIKNVVAVISACYSGSLIDDLQGPHRIIITAARADRTSFGCSNDRDWTFFGDAYFNHALRETTSYQKAFDIAKKLVADWEKQAGVTPSEPQIFVGSSVSQQLSSLTP